MCKSTPPHDYSGAMSSVPDYFCGRLIYELDDGDACKWVVYDGNTKQRFPTRADAEKWCLAHAYMCTRNDLGKLMLCQARLSTVHQALNTLAEAFTDERVNLQLISVNVRRYADQLDNIISRYVQD